MSTIYILLPTAQFQINGFSSSYRFDRNAHDGRILLYVRANIFSKCLKRKNFEENLEAIFA